MALVNQQLIDISDNFKFSAYTSEGMMIIMEIIMKMFWEIP